MVAASPRSYIGNARKKQALRASLPVYVAERVLTSAEILALHTTAIEIVPAVPGNIIVPILAYAFMDYPASGGAAYAAIADGDDLQLRYTDVSGVVALTIETTGFLDQTTDQRRVAIGAPGAGIVPVTGAALVAALGGAITTGNSPVSLRVYYYLIPEAFGVL